MLKRPGLLIFVPGTTAPAKAFDMFKECGSSELFLSTLHSTPEDAGPEGPGLVFANAGGYGYDSKKQEWIKSDFGPYWIGYVKADRPQPEDLERDPMLKGHKVQMGDGNYWLIPTARYYVDVDEQDMFTWAISFPQRRKLKDGHWVHGEVIAKYRELWQTVLRVDEMTERDQSGDPDAFEDITIDDTSGMIVQALAANYRVSAEIVSFLDLVDTSHVAKVYHALTDGPSMPAIRAKKAAASGEQPSLPGVPAA